jgi:hypothetical protein
VRVDLVLMRDDALDEAFGIGTGGGFGAVQRPENLGILGFLFPLKIAGKEELNGGFAAVAAFSHEVRRGRWVRRQSWPSFCRTD